MKRHLAGTCLLLAAMGATPWPAPVHAVTAPFCGRSGAGDWAQIRQSLVGEWQVIHQAGFASVGGMIVPFGGDGKVEMMTMSVSGGNLIGNHPDMQNPLVFRPTDEGRWNVDRGDPYKPDPVMTPDEVGVLHGCDQMELPRMIGSSIAVIEGTQMNFIYRFLAIDPGTLYGVMEVTATMRGQSFLARRTVWLQAAGS